MTDQDVSAKQKRARRQSIDDHFAGCLPKSHEVKEGHPWKYSTKMNRKGNAGIWREAHRRFRSKDQ